MGGKIVPHYLLVHEVATILRRSVRTIYRWLDEGTAFPNAKKVRDGYLIPRSDVEALLKRATLLPPDSAVGPRSVGFVKRWR